MCSSSVPAPGQIFLKASSATSAAPASGPAKATEQAAGRPSVNSPTPTASPPGGYPLAGPSRLPDPATHAYRKDLADAALAGHVIASHYAEPLQRSLAAAATLRAEPDEAAEALAELPAGTILAMLDNSRGWAWGYAGEDRRVGYVRASAVG